MADAQVGGQPWRDVPNTAYSADGHEPVHRYSGADEARLPLSVFIIAKDEADRISRTILSVRDWADEVVVIDSGSADDTVAVSAALGARTSFHAWTGYGPQKRHGETLCRNDWVLNLDADEEVTPDAAAEICSLFAYGVPPLKAYRVRLAEIFPFEIKPHFFGQSKTYVRLYDKSAVRFKDSTVHDTVFVPEDMKVGRLKCVFLHRSLRSHAHTIEKINRYSSMQAENLYRKGRRFGGLRIALLPLYAFFKAYVLRGFIFYGVDGIVQAYIYAFARFIRAAKTRERFRCSEVPD